MKPPSSPQINRENPKVWFIYWNHDVPAELWPKYKRKRVRIKIYDNLNNFKGTEAEREQYADHRRQMWQYNLFLDKYNPFEEELERIRKLQTRELIVEENIEVVHEVIKTETRDHYPVDKALLEYMKSRRGRKLATTSISAYQSSVDWLNEGLTETGHGNVKIGKLKYIHISAALDYIAEDREWVATTINKEMGRMMTIFNWLETEDYVLKNPCRGKFVPLPTQKSKHRWFDRATKDIVKEAVLASGKKALYRAMQFTYETMIRSKRELRMLRIQDIDTELKRIRFSPELSKNGQEQYRDYTPEFEQAITEMKLSNYPREYFVFGKEDGSPGPYMCGHNFFSKQFKPIKDTLGLSPDYTVYGMKHTRIIHELMKGTDGREISHMARHGDFKTTTEYLRDYDITLKNIYGPEDLKF